MRARLAVLFLFLAMSPLADAQTKLSSTTSSLVVVPDIAQRVAKFKPVEMPFNSQGLSPRERQLVEKFVEASHYVEAIYWRQNDPEALALYQQLAGSKEERDQLVRKYIFIN